MNFVYRGADFKESDYELLSYWAKYLSLPDGILKEYDQKYRNQGNYNPNSLYIAEDKSRNCALLLVTLPYTKPGGYYPGVYALFIEEEIIVFNVIGRFFEIHKNGEKKNLEIIYKIMPINIPKKYLELSDDIKNIIAEALKVFEFEGKDSQDKEIAFTVLFDCLLDVSMIGRSC